MTNYISHILFFTKGVIYSSYQYIFILLLYSQNLLHQRVSAYQYCFLLLYNMPHHLKSIVGIIPQPNLYDLSLRLYMELSLSTEWVQYNITRITHLLDYSICNIKLHRAKVHFFSFTPLGTVKCSHSCNISPNIFTPTLRLQQHK